MYIPGYTIDSDGNQKRPPKENEDAHAKLLPITKKRVSIMNVHQFLLWISLQKEKGHIDWPVPINYEDIVHGNSLEGPLGPYAAFSRGRYHTQKYLQKDALKSPSETPRRAIGWSTLGRSLAMLDDVLSREDDKLIKLLEEIYFAVSQQYEGRLGISLIGLWAVIEQLLDQMWGEKVANSSISGSRRQKLKSRDYTSSVRIETLRLMGYINDEAYSNLEAARKARNAWIHGMKEPSCNQLQNAKNALKKFMLDTQKIDLLIPYDFGSVGGYKSIWGDQRAMDRLLNGR